MKLDLDATTRLGRSTGVLLLALLCSCGDPGPQGRGTGSRQLKNGWVFYAFSGDRVRFALFTPRDANEFGSNSIGGGSSPTVLEGYWRRRDGTDALKFQVLERDGKVERAIINGNEYRISEGAAFFLDSGLAPHLLPVTLNLSIAELERRGDAFVEFGARWLASK